MKLAVKTAAGQEEQINVSDQCFAREFNEGLVHQVVNAQMAGLRAGTKAQKNRSAVRGGGRKPWRQKGTGRARAGSIRSPIWRGGGRAFAAQPRSYKQKVNRQMYRGALASVLSELIRRKSLVLVDTFALEAPKTKLLSAELKAKQLEGETLIVTEYLDENLYLASRNMPMVQVLEAGSFTPYDGVRFNNVVMTVGALKKIEEALA